MNEEYLKRLKRVQDASDLKEPDRVPINFVVSVVPFFLSDDATYKDTYYDYPKASEAVFDFYRDFPIDAYFFPGMTSGKSNEIAQSKMIEWPGKPGTTISNFSTHQVLEYEFLFPEEYPEFLSDFTGFMLRKYIPRVFPGLSGLESVKFTPSTVLSTTPLAGLYSPGALEAYDKLKEIGKNDAEAGAANRALIQRVGEELGIPSFVNGAGEAPFDILSDYFRGTLGMLEDQLYCPDLVAKACDMLADIQIAHFAYFKADMPFKRVFFPLHKGMDGFISPEQYTELYWKPLKKVMLALIDMGATPYIYTEGPYNTRLEQLADVPPGKVMYHFETVDIKRAKEVLGDVACIVGNFPVYHLEYSSKERVIEETKKLLDICMPGGGYIFDCDKSIDNVKRENLEAMVETVLEYGKY